MVKKIFIFLKNNFIRKTSFFKWIKTSDIISNYFFLYLLSSSLILDILKKVNSRFFSNKHFYLYFKNGVILKVPLDNYQGAQSFVYSNDYFSNYKQAFNMELDFSTNEVVIDIGAHCGSFIIPLLCKSPKIKAHIFEPHPGNFSVLKENLEVNKVNLNDVKYSNVAVFDRFSTIAFDLGSTSTIASVTESGFYKNRSQNEVQVPCVSLKEYFQENNISKCKLLKIDCEGSEYRILMSQDPSFFKSIENLIVEAHPTKNEKPSELKHFLSNHGYEIKEVVLDNGCWEMFCRRKDLV